MGKPRGCDTVSLYHGRAGSKRQAVPKEYFNRTPITSDEQRLVSEAEYQTAQTKNFLDKIYEGNAKGLVSNLIMGDLLTDEEYEDLKKLLEKGKEQQ